jgi:dihydroflavonol-4-reductase
MPLAPRGGLNLVDVRDAAAGQLLAAERGRPGRRYVLGGENVTFHQLFSRLAEVAGFRPRGLGTLPRWLEWPLAAAAELRGALRKREPYPSFEQVRLARFAWFYGSSRARLELGFEPRPLGESLRDAFQWHRSRHRLELRGLPRLWMRPGFSETIRP